MQGVAKSVLNEINVPITTEDNLEKYGIYVDFPPVYDKYRRQKILVEIEAAVEFILRAFYGDYRLLPQVEGMFIDIRRYKHILNQPGTSTRLATMVENSLGAVLEDLTPSINVEYDESHEMMIYHITIYGNTELSVTDGLDLRNAEISINKKKFYE